MTANGTAIRAIRRAQKLGLRALARKTGLDRGYLSKLERGLPGPNPDSDKVLRIAQALQVPPDLISREEKP